MKFLLIPLVFVGGIALLFGIGFLVILIECIFSSETRQDTFGGGDGEWVGITIVALLGWVIFGACLFASLHL